MNEINITPPEGYVIDEENSSFTCIKLKKKEKKYVKSWKDLGDLEGYYISTSCDVFKAFEVSSNDLNDRNVFATKEQAEACIALAMLSQLRKNVNKDWIPDWTDNQRKHCITFYFENPVPVITQTNSSFLAFPTAEIRDTFLKNHEELIIKAKPLL